MIKRVNILCLLLLFALVPLSSNSTEDNQEAPAIEIAQPPIIPGTDQEPDFSDSGGLLEGFATSDGFFSVSFMPDFSFGKVLLQLNVKLEGQATFDPFDVSFDFSDYKIPTREEGQPFSDYSKSVLIHFSRFIRSIQYGQRYDPIYLKFGKLIGITLGNGSLINGYFDRGVPARSSRAGLDVMLDGSLLKVPYAGFEFITNDIFDPTLIAWRIFAQPMYEFTDYPNLSKLRFGLSFATNPQREEEEQAIEKGRKLIAIDVSYPLLSNKLLSLDLFSDLIFQLPDSITTEMGIATRYGIWGHSGEFFVFNSSITKPRYGVFYSDYFASGFESRTPSELEKSQIPLQSSRIDSMVGLNFSKLGLYVKSQMSSLYTNGDYSDYRFSVQGKIDKRLFNIVSLDLRYEKLYPTSTGEAFFEGLRTLRNVDITATTVVKIKPYTFDIGLTVQFDENAELTYQIESAVRITIL